MEEPLIEAKILSCILDGMTKKEIVQEAIKDCDGDCDKAHRLVVKVAKECM